MFDPKLIKKDFPIFDQDFGGKKLIYLDNAATSQKPRQVIEAMNEYYFKYNAAVSRSSHFLADLANQKYDDARAKTANFIGAKPEEIIFTKNATESLNLTAYGWGLHNLKKGDVILTTTAEHNSSLLPWKQVAELTNAEVDYLNIDEFGNLEPNWQQKINEKVKVVVIQHVSNVLGNILPLKQICARCNELSCAVIVDGSQSIGHFPINVKTMGCDFFAFSGHKILGPTGTGVLYGKYEILEKTMPFLLGGGVIKKLSTNSSNASMSYKEIPYRFEAGTPNVAGAIGLGAAVDYLNALGIENVRKHEIELCKYCMEELSEIEGLKILGPKDATQRTGLVSFTLANVHSHDISAILSSQGVAVRSGLHCTMSLYKNLDIPSSTRASFSVYNTLEDIDKLIEGVKEAAKILLPFSAVKGNRG